LVFAVSQVCFSRIIGGRLFPPVVLPFVLALANDVNSLTIAALMWAVLVRPSGFWGRLLNQPVAVGLGVLSYSIYLWHVLLCEKEEPAWLCSFPQNLVFILLVAMLSYRCIERPFLAWKERLAVDRPPGELLPAGNRSYRLATLGGYFRFLRPVRPSRAPEEQNERAGDLARRK